MSLTTTGAMSETEINNEFDDGRDELAASAALAGRTVPFRFYLAAPDAAAEVRDRSVYFKVDDTYELRGIRLEVRGHASTAQDYTARLQAIEQNDGLAVSEHLVGDRSDLFAQVSTTDSTVQRGYLNLTSARPMFLHVGFLYRMLLEIDTGIGLMADMQLFLRAIRRDR